MSCLEYLLALHCSPLYAALGTVTSAQCRLVFQGQGELLNLATNAKVSIEANLDGERHMFSFV